MIIENIINSIYLLNQKVHKVTKFQIIWYLLKLFNMANMAHLVFIHIGVMRDIIINFSTQYLNIHNIFSEYHQNIYEKEWHFNIVWMPQIIFRTFWTSFANNIIWYHCFVDDIIDWYPWWIYLSSYFPRWPSINIKARNQINIDRTFSWKCIIINCVSWTTWV